MSQISTVAAIWWVGGATAQSLLIAGTKDAITYDGIPYLSTGSSPGCFFFCPTYWPPFPQVAVPILPLGMGPFHLFCFWSSFLLTYLGKQQIIAQEFGSLPSTRETRMEFLALAWSSIGCCGFWEWRVNWLGELSPFPVYTFLLCFPFTIVAFPTNKKTFYKNIVRKIKWGGGRGKQGGKACCYFT